MNYGKNELIIKSDNCEITIILYRLPNKISNKNSGSKKVRILYVVSKDDPTHGEFQSDNQKENKLENALKRIDLGKLTVYLILWNFLLN